MTTALYRRYRPESFGEMIGQAQVTEPLMTALRGDRVGHAYLFSGPRGCGKTTSARILARCLNCAEGPTDVPCGTCPSCVELSRDGGGSLDVVEIDAASHNGVDDARDLRERATFAPSRDRFKIFILDEAHMVTPQGFNALLKLVEEPPPHVKFIFATTEPEKVLGTIRSRTHHYPFRLVPPAAMLEYVEKLCVDEGVVVEGGVLPLVVRAGGGSPRDTLSLLDQLIAGSDSPAGSETVSVAYERAVSLLGYTHAALLDEIVDALAAADPAAAFPAIDRVVQTGQDPRRFVDDLLERLRDLIVIAAVGRGASAVLRGIADDELDRMRIQADAFGAARLSRTADIVSAALDDMSGATSPRLHLELMTARVLAASAVVPGNSAAHTQSVPGAAPASTPPDSASALPKSVSAAPTQASTAAVQASTAPVQTSTAPENMPEPDAAEDAPSPAQAAPVTLARVSESWPAVLARLAEISRTSWLLATAVQPLAFDTDTAVLTLGFASQHDVQKFKGSVPGSGPSDHLRTAIQEELGVKVKYLPAPLPGGGPSSPAGAPSAELPSSGQSSSGGSSTPESSSRPAPRSQARGESAAAVTEWAVAPIPSASELQGSALVDDPLPPSEPPYDDEPPYDPQAEQLAPQQEVPTSPQEPPQNPARTSAVAEPRVSAADAEQRARPREGAAPGGVQRYGEAVIRQVLGATFVREEPYEPPTRFS